MPDPIPQTPPGPHEPVNPSVRFERTDANVRGIVIFALGAVVVTVLVHLLFMTLRARLNEPEKPAGAMSSLISQDRVRLPQGLDRVPAPRLQIDQQHDLAELRQRDTELLDNKRQPYAWVDAKAGVVRIPIERAMDLVADPKTAAAHGIRVKTEGK